MRIRKAMYVLVAVVTACGMAACGKSSNTEYKHSTKAVQETKNTNEETPTPKEEETDATTSEKPDKESIKYSRNSGAADTTKQSIKIYYGNDTAEFIMYKTVDVQKKTPEELVNQLKKADVLKEDIQLNNVQENKTTKGLVIELDFNEAFSNQLKAYGSAGERIMIGSVVNTFIKAYGAESKVLLTVNGEAPESGNKIYDEPISFYAPIEKTVKQIRLSVGTKVQIVEVTRKYCQLGFAYEYDTKVFEERMDTSENRLTLQAKKDANTYLQIYKSSQTLQEEKDAIKKLGEGTSQVEITIGEDHIVATAIDHQEKLSTSIYYVFEKDKTVWRITLHENKRTSESQKARLMEVIDSFEVVQ